MSPASQARQCPPSAFERLQIGDDVDDLIALEPELRHGWVFRDDSLRQRPLQAFDRIFQMQGAERRRDREGTLADLVDGMTLLAMRAKKRQAALLVRRLLCESDIAAQAERDCAERDCWPAAMRPMFWFHPVSPSCSADRIRARVS